MGPLGFYNICLRTDNLDKTVAFYRGLGFEPTGEDAPGLRVSLANGEDVLTFMTFLDADLINFRGAHIHRLMSQIREAGLAVTGYNEMPDEQPLMLDATGKPLPDNECGHFTVRAPDGHELFFNTHPHERAPFEAALAGGTTDEECARQPRLLGRLVYCQDVTDLHSALAFYETLGLRAVRDSDGAWITPPLGPRAVRFTLRLCEAGTAGSWLRFYGGTASEGVLQALGFAKAANGWTGFDPDQRRLALLPDSTLGDAQRLI